MRITTLFRSQMSTKGSSKPSLTSKVMKRDQTRISTSFWNSRCKKSWTECFNLRSRLNKKNSSSNTYLKVSSKKFILTLKGSHRCYGPTLLSFRGKNRSWRCTPASWLRRRTGGRSALTSVCLLRKLLWSKRTSHIWRWPKLSGSNGPYSPILVHTRGKRCLTSISIKCIT